MRFSQEKHPKYCPRCGKQLKVRKGRYGTYLDCTGYPECKYTIEFSSKGFNEKELRVPTECPRCGNRLALYLGKNGLFLGCNGYPQCRFSYNFENPNEITCPKCSSSMKERSGKYSLFYGCVNYPDCKFTFPLRVKGVKKERKSIKKIALPKNYGMNIKANDILQLISSDGVSISDLIKKLKITDEMDIKYLKLKLKKFERKGFIIKTLIEREFYWKKNY